ncbi:hypothetical protein BU23DRAFT_130917 [Bimuria novae-zelandiae CBS 107.79]|uniref:Uncharacterized protein n=1 Tax=Bimuria novae-zelandiae CBS 107.79 TaxID=1447943 RepID=A0A6A5VBT4_9PLEO|nr:hypothetical protein BU23DRAFT_130917 [Bimuria novae-zelandiae CBS 107.79]
MILGLQAILHFQNLPTLVMLTATSYCVETAILTLCGHSSQSRLEIGRLVIATLCCAGILLGEYRLLPQVLETAIPAVLLTGAARAFWSIIYDTSAHTTIIARHVDALLCVVGSLLTSACIFFRRGNDETVERLNSALEFRYLPLLALNLFATAIAIRTGKSVLVPIDNGKNGEGRDEVDENTSDIITLFAITGIAGTLSASKLRRSYTSWPQYIFFAFVMVLWSSRGLTVRQGRSCMAMYNAIPNDIALHSVDSEATIVSVLSERSDNTCVSAVQASRKSIFFRILLFAIALPTWLAYLTLNFSEQVHENTTEAHPILDLNYTPQTDVEFVISMYKEPINQVAHLISTLKKMPNMPDPQIHIYIKDIDTNLEEIQQGTGAHKVTPLPNIGREGETYLKHILGSWDTLAKQTVFLQADVHNPREFYPRIRDYFVPDRTGMLSLGWSGQVCNCENCGDRFNMWDNTHLFPEISNRINNATKCDKVLLSYKGQFIASAKRIRGVDKSVYQDLHKAFVDRDSWAHQEEYLQGRRDSMDAPVFGYTMERMWNLLFQCNSMDVAWKCPTLLSGNRIGGSVEDCQCLDPVL